MENNQKWYFAPANHGEIKGENTGDKEIFKKEPYVSLAREIIQNSIDARNDDSIPVEIDFKEFKMKVKDVPGIDDYRAQIRRCAEYWSTNSEFQKKYQEILNYIDNNKEINCLRISDRNTTGLCGISSLDSTADNSYNCLVKGSGVSKKKDDFAGGSKGVGKNVPYLLSMFMMVFYDTKTIKNEEGYIGVAKLSSGYVDDTDDPQRDYTQGTGYFAKSNLVQPINSHLNFEPSYSRDKDETGTDIYIIGFNSDEDWINDVISSTLESFLVAIDKDSLIININDNLISSYTLEQLLNSNLIDKNKRKSIIAQYELSSNIKHDVIIHDIDTDFGLCKLYIKGYKKNNVQDASKKCFMIRKPYMFIKSYDVHYDVSAMVIIENNKLGSELRNIENAQHNNWEPKRITDKARRDAITNAINSIKEQMTKHIQDFMKSGDAEPIDPFGAGEFLADTSVGEQNDDSKSKILEENDEASIGEIRKVNQRIKDASIESEKDNGLQPDVGSIEENDEGDETTPTGHNDITGGAPRPGDNPGVKKTGDNIIISKSYLTGVKYKVISTDKENGKLRIVFIAPESHEKCYLNLNLVDDANNTLKMEILELICNGINVVYDDAYEPGTFAIIKNLKTILDVKVNRKDYFACEVRIKYENR